MSREASLAMVSSEERLAWRSGLPKYTSAPAPANIASNPANTSLWFMAHSESSFEIWPRKRV